jgi:MOSC domain-containing protein YiiM
MGTSTEGTIVGIFTAPSKGAPTVTRPDVEAVAGQGLVGDRHFDANVGDHDPADEITLIETGGLRQAETDHGVVLGPGEHRRNLVVDELDLVALVGRTVRVGGAEVELLADNPPCRYLQDLTGKPVLRALRRKGGVRGRIVTSGIIRVGDPVVPIR